MQDNSQFAGYDAQQQSNPYDDQKTIPVPQEYIASTSSYTQEAGPFSHIPEAPAPPYEPGGMPYGGVPSGPALRKKKPGKKILIIGSVLGLIVLLAIGGAILLPKMIAAPSNQSAASTSAPVTTPAKKNIYTPYLVRYRVPIRNQIALGLHLSADQLQTQINAGQTLSNIASTQGVSSSQLQTLVTSAFQSGFQPAVQSNDLTQGQVDILIKRMLKQPQTLDRYLAVKTKKATSSTPAATPAA